MTDDEMKNAKPFQDMPEFDQRVFITLSFGAIDCCKNGYDKDKFMSSCENIWMSVEMNSEDIDQYGEILRQLAHELIYKKRKQYGE